MDLRGSQTRLARGDAFWPGPFRVERHQLKRRAVAQQAGDERGMHGVSGAFGHNVSKNMMAGQSQIANQVEDLVAGELVAETQIAVQDAVTAEHDDTFFSGAADQAHIAQLLFVFAPAKGSRRGDVALVSARGKINLVALAADGRRKIHLIGDGVAAAGVHSDEFVAFSHLDVFENAEILAAAALLLEANLAKRLGVRQSAAVENGQLEIVEFDSNVIDAAAKEGGEQMFGGGDENALAHQAGGVRNFGDVASGGGDFETVEIGAAKDNARTRRSGQQAHSDRSTAVEANAGELDRGGNCVFQVR